MRYLAATTLLLLLGGSSCALLAHDAWIPRVDINSNGLQHGSSTLQRPDGSTTAGEYVDDKRNGQWIDKYPNGAMKLVRSLKNEVLHGPYRSYFGNGRVETEGRFVDGYKFGVWRHYSASGDLVEETSYLNGQAYGVCEKLRAGGQLASRSLLYGGRRVGHVEAFDAAGNPVEAWEPMPDGVEWVSETWEGSDTAKREGFTLDGKPHGLWKSFHRSGALRAVGALDRGRASGPWEVYAEIDGLVATGAADLGQATGPWEVFTSTETREEDGASFRSGNEILTGWSESALFAPRTAGVAANTAMDEIASNVPEGAVISQAPVDSEAPVAELTEPEKVALAEAAAPQSVPVDVQRFTDLERRSFQAIVDYYNGVEGAIKELRGLYGGGSSAGSSAAKLPKFPEPGGDRPRSDRFIGKVPPMTEFLSADGESFSLKQHRGRKVVLVLLRGYGGKICPYCVAQTRALCADGSLEAFRERGTELEVVFPGGPEGLEGFQEAYGQLADNERSAYRMRYADAHEVAQTFDLVGEKVAPTTLILDLEGKVRFAYVGKTAEDRPSLKVLIAELDRIDNE